VVVLVIIPAILSGHPTVASASGSTQPTAAHSGGVTGSSESPSLAVDTTQPEMTFTTHYTVKKGDRFAAIAKKYHLQQWELLAANPLVTNAALLKVGTVLNIPDPGQMAKPTPTPKPTVTVAPAASASPAT
jgi:LysM repeat protein